MGRNAGMCSSFLCGGGVSGMLSALDGVLAANWLAARIG